MAQDTCDCDKRIDELEKYLLAMVDGNRRIIEQNYEHHEMAREQAVIERERGLALLKEQIQQRIEAGDSQVKEQIMHLKEMMNSTFTSSEKAITKAETAHEKRFETDQQFRDQLRDQQTTLMPRELAESNSIELREKIERSDVESMSRDEMLRGQISELQSAQAATRATMAVVGGVVSIFLTCVVILVNVLLKWMG